MTARGGIISRIEAYLSGYMAFPDPSYALVGAVWAAVTHLWPHFDALPYLVVTAETKQSGKTLFGIDLMSFLCAMPVTLGGMTPAVAFRTIDADKPTLLVDEAETLDSEQASDLRAALNMGYKRGAKFRRAAEGRRGIIEFDVYCPKLFVLIGDVYDTLHDRSIIMRLARGKPEKRFFRRTAEAEGNALRAELSELAALAVGEVNHLYAKHEGLPFLSSRDEEIWTPMFCVLQALEPKLFQRLLRAAVDFAAEKTAERRSYVKLLGDGVEGRARDDEFAQRLVADLLTVIDGNKYVLTGEALPKLCEIDTAPWRRYRGRGLSAIDMGNMLDRFGVGPQNIKVNGKVLKGYKREAVAAALKRITE